MLKRILAIASLFATVGTAHAQLPSTMANQVRIADGHTINLRSVRIVGLKPGAQFFIDRMGRETPITLTTVAQVKTAPAFLDFVHIGDDVWANAGEAKQIYCGKDGTVIEWLYTAPQTLRGDGCSVSRNTDDGSRRQ